MAQVNKINRRNGSNSSHRKLGKTRSKNIKRFKCEQCDFRGKSKSAMNCHSVVHTGEKPYMCTFPGCNFRAGWKSGIKKHLVSHAAIRDKVLIYRCDQCEYRAPANSYLRQHKVVHLNSNAFACDYPSCNFRTKSKPRLMRHKKVKHACENRQLYSCDQCNYSSKIKWNLSNHVKTHAEESIACQRPGCNFRCRLAWNLKLHTRQYHDPSESYFLYCNVDGCAFKTTYKPTWKKHLETHNPNREPLVCTLCSGSFYAPEALERHVALCHTGEEWYSCKLCKFSSKYNTALKKHMKEAHASAQEKELEKTKIQVKYKCSFCNQTSKHKRDLGRHVRSRHGHETNPGEEKSDFLLELDEVGRTQKANSRKSTPGNDKNKDPTLAVGGGKEPGSFDSKKAHETSQITRVFACGLCVLLSTTFYEALVHSVEHRTLLISLERVVIR